MDCDFDIFRIEPASLWRQLKKGMQDKLLVSQSKRQPAKSCLKPKLLDEVSPDYKKNLMIRSCLTFIMRPTSNS